MSHGTYLNESWHTYERVHSYASIMAHIKVSHGTYMYTCVYVCICVSGYIRTCTYRKKKKNLGNKMIQKKNFHIYICTCKYLCTYKQIHICAYIHENVCLYIYMYTHIYLYVYIDVYIYIYICIDTDLHVFNKRQRDRTYHMGLSPQKSPVVETLQHIIAHTTTHCNTLQTATLTATHCATRCNTLQHTPQHNATHCNTLQQSGILSGIFLQHTATHCNIHTVYI